MHRSSTICFAALILALSVNDNQVFGQAGLRDALAKMDRNENGHIDPDEVTPLSRPFLERILQNRNRWWENPFREPIRIERILDAARRHYAQANGVDGRDVQPRGENSVREFGIDEDQPIIPDFGLARIRFPYISDDLQLAERIIGEYDEDGDGFIDRKEASRHRWTHRNPFADDIDKDNRISKLELTQRYARRRLLREDAEEFWQRDRRGAGEIDWSQKEEDPNQWWRRGGKTTWLTASMMGRFDSNRNGRLEEDEVARTGIPMGSLDLDSDGEVTRDELHVLVTQMQNEAGDTTEGLPGWFYEKDMNRDNQIAMSEFAEELSVARREEFQTIDVNGDGFLTVQEVVQSALVAGGSYRNEKAEVMPPRRTIISEIEVEDDFIVADLNVQISVTHSNVDQLDAYLTGPEGQRVELFTQVGGSGDHFDGTVFDDQTETPVAKAKPPFKGTYRPEAIDKKQPGLGSFNGKSVMGVWQLVIRGTRSDRFGMLHSWGITAKPAEDLESSEVEAGIPQSSRAPDGHENPKAEEQRDGESRKDGSWKKNDPAKKDKIKPEKTKVENIEKYLEKTGKQGLEGLRKLLRDNR